MDFKGFVSALSDVRATQCAEKLTSPHLDLKVSRETGDRQITKWHLNWKKHDVKMDLLRPPVDHKHTTMMWHKSSICGGLSFVTVTYDINGNPISLLSPDLVIVCYLDKNFQLKTRLYNAKHYIIALLYSYLLSKSRHWFHVGSTFGVNVGRQCSVYTGIQPLDVNIIVILYLEILLLVI